MKTHAQSGQVLLITLLVLSFAAIIVLSLIARTTKSRTISTQIDDSAKALSAAEAGLELALQSHSGVGMSTTETGVNYVVTSPAPIAVATEYTLREKTPKGGLANIWLAEHKKVGSEFVLDEDPGNDFDEHDFDLCWSNDADPAAVIVTILYKGNDGVYKVGKGAYDSVSSRSQGFSWSNAHSDCPPATAIGQRIHFSDVIGPYNANQTTLLALRARPLYHDTQFSVYTGTKNLPSQGNLYTSTGTTDSGTSRAVQVEEMFPAPGALFDYVIYSQQGDFRQ